MGHRGLAAGMVAAILVLVAALPLAAKPGKLVGGKGGSDELADCSAGERPSGITGYSLATETFFASVAVECVATDDKQWTGAPARGGEIGPRGPGAVASAVSCLPNSFVSHLGIDVSADGHVGTVNVFCKDPSTGQEVSVGMLTAPGFTKKTSGTSDCTTHLSTGILGKSDPGGVVSAGLDCDDATATAASSTDGGTTATTAGTTSAGAGSGAATSAGGSETGVCEPSGTPFITDTTGVLHQAVNVHSGPKKTCKTEFVIGPRKVDVVSGCPAGWCAIVADTEWGYVSKSLVDFGGGVGSTTPPKPGSPIPSTTPLQGTITFPNGITIKIGP